jgi:hypothetical protein
MHLGPTTNEEDGLMRKLTITLAATALVLGSMALAANAQNQQAGAASLHKLSQNMTPIHTPANCRGWTGRMGCGPGWIFSRRAGRCVPC